MLRIFRLDVEDAVPCESVVHHGASATVIPEMGGFLYLFPRKCNPLPFFSYKAVACREILGYNVSKIWKYAQAGMEVL